MRCHVASFRQVKKRRSYRSTFQTGRRPMIARLRAQARARRERDIAPRQTKDNRIERGRFTGNSFREGPVGQASIAEFGYGEAAATVP